MGGGKGSAGGQQIQHASLTASREGSHWFAAGLLLGRLHPGVQLRVNGKQRAGSQHKAPRACARRTAPTALGPARTWGGRKRAVKRATSLLPQRSSNTTTRARATNNDVGEAGTIVPAKVRSGSVATNVAERVLENHHGERPDHWPGCAHRRPPQASTGAASATTHQQDTAGRFFSQSRRGACSRYAFT